MVECDLAKVEVAGSNPVSRSSLLLDPFGFSLLWRRLAAPRSPSEKAEGFIEAPALEEAAQAMAENQVQSTVGQKYDRTEVRFLSNSLLARHRRHGRGLPGRLTTEENR